MSVRAALERGIEVALEKGLIQAKYVIPFQFLAKELPEVAKDLVQAEGSIGTAAEKIVEATMEVTKKLSLEKIIKYLSDVDSVPQNTLIQDMVSIGLKVKDVSKDGLFMNFIDNEGILRAKVHPPDKITKNYHLHIYNQDGNFLNKVLEVVSRKSSDEYIPIKGL